MNNLANRALAAAAFAGSVLSMVCSDARPADSQKSIPITPEPSVHIYSLNDSELAYHKQRALMGDVDSGGCLAMHFAYVDIRNPDTEYWITIAAENGDAIAMKMLALRLESKANPREVRRAAFWNERSAISTSRSNLQCHRDRG